MTNRKNIIPVLLGADLNAYSVALAFRDFFGVTSHVFARYRCGATENSKFIITHINEGICDVSVAVPELLKFAAENNGAELFLIPTADWYVEMMMQARPRLSGIYNIYMPDSDIWRALSDKAEFYSLMKKSEIPHPPYISFEKGDKLTEKNLSGFGFPAVIKPSDSSLYWRHPFSDMRKVYFPKDAAAAEKIIKKIFSSGYDKRVIFQKKIARGAKNRVLTTLSDSQGRVVRAVLGDVILEECGKTSQGNHAAIITRPLNDLSFRLIGFLSKAGYRGIANIDIMASDDGEYVLELNPRQGRSCDYLRAAGVNIAELIVRCGRGERVEPDFSYKKIYWHHPPHDVVMKYAEKEMRDEAERLRQEGGEYTPYGNEYEGARRAIYVYIHNMRMRNRIKKSMKEG